MSFGKVTDYLFGTGGLKEFFGKLVPKISFPENGESRVPECRYRKEQRVIPSMGDFELDYDIFVCTHTGMIKELNNMFSEERKSMPIRCDVGVPSEEFCQQCLVPGYKSMDPKKVKTYKV